MTQRVFVDANVLVSKTCSDWLFLLRMANEGMFQLLATEDVFAEVLRGLRKKHQRLPGGVIKDKLEKMHRIFDEVLPDFAGDVSFTGSDEGDYHVHAAAVAAKADILLTHNRASDFTRTPDDELYEVMQPDDFFVLVADSHPACLIAVTREQHDYWNEQARRGRQYTPLDDALRRAGCPEFADRVRDALRQLALTG